MTLPVPERVLAMLEANGGKMISHVLLYDAMQTTKMGKIGMAILAIFGLVSMCSADVQGIVSTASSDIGTITLVAPVELTKTFLSAETQGSIFALVDNTNNNPLYNEWLVVTLTKSDVSGGNASMQARWTPNDVDKVATKTADGTPIYIDLSEDIQTAFADYPGYTFEIGTMAATRHLNASEFLAVCQSIKVNKN